ncbi:MAG: DMT family transporter [Candidatus Moranbacteria bacterium]|nr:DMT family transporter [Candidatus Moranbacteria bacterium]
MESLLWGFFPIMTVLALKNMPTLLTLAWSTLFGAFFFALIITFKKGWQQIKNPNALKDILLSTFLLGVLYYLLFFFGLRYTSPGNASLIALTETFFSFCFFNLWRKEFVTSKHIFGAILMFAGSVIVLYPNIHGFRLGDILILSAGIVAPLGNFFQRRARKSVNSETILFVRSLLSAIVIFILAYFTKTDFSSVDLKKVFVFLVINGFFLLGLSKFLWIEGIYRIGVMKANALNGLAPLVTLLFAWILLKNIPTPFQLLAFVPMFFGILLLSENPERKKLENVR